MQPTGESWVLEISRGEGGGLGEAESPIDFKEFKKKKKRERFRMTWLESRLITKCAGNAEKRTLRRKEKRVSTKKG